MSWDEKAEDYAQAHHVYGHLDVATNYHGFRMVVEGARWQREALLADDVIERAAQAGFARGADLAAKELGLTEPVVWSDLLEKDRDNLRGQTRAALAAALGEES